MTKRAKSPLSRASSCDGKVKHATFAIARRASKRTPHGSATPRWPYRCSHCGSYHVGGGIPRKGRPKPELEEFEVEEP